MWKISQGHIDHLKKMQKEVYDKNIAKYDEDIVSMCLEKYGKTEGWHLYVDTAGNPSVMKPEFSTRYGDAHDILALVAFASGNKKLDFTAENLKLAIDYLNEDL